MFYICKMCGRAIRSEEKPKCCYFDRIDHLENISDEDAKKMGLYIPDGKTFEFPGDVRWDPFTGDPMIEMAFEDMDVGLRHLREGNLISGRTLRDFQKEVMEQVCRGLK